MSKLLLDEQPLVILPKLATTIGLNEAIVLQQLHYWLEKSTHIYDEHRWVYNTYEGWVEQFPFWSVSTIRRTISKLEKIDVVITGNYNKIKIDNTKWYRINYEQLRKIENGYLKKEESPSVQNEQVDGAFEQTSVQNEQTIVQCGQSSGSMWADQQVILNKPIPEITTEITTEITRNKDDDDKASLTNTFNNQSYAKVVRTYEENIGMLPPLYLEIFAEWFNKFGEPIIVEAIKRAVSRNKRFWKYFESILIDWEKNNVKSIADIAALDDVFEQDKQRRQKQKNVGNRKPVRQEAIPAWLESAATTEIYNETIQNDVNVDEQRKQLEAALKQFKKE